jgi:hypothetical protein
MTSGPKNNILGPTLGLKLTLIKSVLKALSQGVNRQGREADHSLPSSAKVKKVGANFYSPTSLCGTEFNQLSTR